jgi:hypothetical protein
MVAINTTAMRKSIEAPLDLCCTGLDWCGILGGSGPWLAEASVSVLRQAGTSVEEEGEGKEELSPATPA